MRLGIDDQAILDGRDGPVLQKVMKTLVMYGNVLGAETLVPIEGSGHFAIHHVLPGIGPRLQMLEELVSAGLTTKFPFTLDPRPPLDFENLALTQQQQDTFREMFADQKQFEAYMSQLGLRDDEAYSCTPYLPEVGNIPRRGQVLAWSESSCVVFANSVLGARTNRNAVIIDLMSNIIGKTPYTGLLTDEGRKASWLIDVRTSALPHPQLLGGVIGKRVVDAVPWIAGLERFLEEDIGGSTTDYLKEMGAACAALGAVGLYHVENRTPEARDMGRSLLRPDFQTVIVDDDVIENALQSYPVMWKKPESRPERCIIGCPHLSLREIYRWLKQIDETLASHGKKTVALSVTMCAAPQVLKEFSKDKAATDRLTELGIKLSPTCPEAFMGNPHCSRQSVMTSSNKLRAYSSAKLQRDEALLNAIATGSSDPERL